MWRSCELFADTPAQLQQRSSGSCPRPSWINNDVLFCTHMGKRHPTCQERRGSCLVRSTINRAPCAIGGETACRANQLQ